MKISLSIQTEAGESYLLQKDAHDYPDLISLSKDRPLEDYRAKKAKGKALYEALTGKKYPHPNATTRQVLWDFIEVAIKHLP